MEITIGISVVIFDSRELRLKHCSRGRVSLFQYDKTSPFPICHELISNHATQFISIIREECIYIADGVLTDRHFIVVYNRLLDEWVACSAYWFAYAYIFQVK